MFHSHCGIVSPKAAVRVSKWGHTFAIRAWNRRRPAAVSCRLLRLFGIRPYLDFDELFGVVLRHGAG